MRAFLAARVSSFGSVAEFPPGGNLTVAVDDPLNQVYRDRGRPTMKIGLSRAGPSEGGPAATASNASRVWA